MKCPVCGQEKCQIITETTTSGKNYSAGKGICGSMLLGSTGVLCGFCGKGQQMTSTSYWVCLNCGNKWKV